MQKSWKISFLYKVQFPQAFPTGAPETFSWSCFLKTLGFKDELDRARWCKDILYYFDFKCYICPVPVVHEPVRPDNDEDVESDDEAQEAEDNVASAEVDERADDLDHVVDQADDRQHNPRHHQTGFSLKTKSIKRLIFPLSNSHLPGTVDEKGGNDNVADAEDQKDRHHGCCPWGKGRQMVRWKWSN